MKKQCTQYPVLGQPGPVRRTSDSKYCEPCRQTMADAEFAAIQNPTLAKRPRVSSEGKPREARLRLLKRDLVTQMLGKPGEFREAVKKVRSSWGIVAPPVQLPPESEDLLPPVLRDPRDLSELHTAWAHHPELPPLRGGPKDEPSSNTVWPSDELTLLRNLERQWQNDLKYALRCGDVPEMYLEESPPYEGYPPTSTRLRSWHRFAAACVLYDVPPSEAEKFADEGGIPSLRGEVKGESILGAIGPSQLRERTLVAAEREAYDKLLWEKLWALRHELGGDLEQAKAKVSGRFAQELQAECDRARKNTELWLEFNPPHRYYVEFDPEEDKPTDISRMVGAILAQCGINPGDHGSLPQGDFRYVQIARLLEKPGWSEARVAAWSDLLESTVRR